MTNINGKNYNQIITHNVELQEDFFAEDGKLTLNNPETPKRVEEFYEKAPQDSFKKIIFFTDDHVNNIYEKTEEHTEQGFNKHCIYGTKGWELMVNTDEVEARHKNVFYIGKDTTNAWLDKESSGYIPTDSDFKNEKEIETYNNLFKVKTKPGAGGEIVANSLNEFVGNLENSVVVLTGGATDICVKLASEGYLKRGADVIILEDLVKGLFQEAPEVIEELIEKYNLKDGQLIQMTSDELLAELEFDANEKKLTQRFNNENKLQK